MVEAVASLSLMQSLTLRDTKRIEYLTGSRHCVRYTRHFAQQESEGGVM